MNDLSIYEAADIVKNLEFVDRNDRELKRYELYVAIQSNSKKQISLKDVFSLPWDKIDIDDEKIDEEKLKRLEEKTNTMIDMLNSGKLKIGAADLIN